MPMIDVISPTGLFPAGAERELAQRMTAALLKAEGVSTPAAAHLNNTAAYIHRLPAETVHTAATGSARTVRLVAGTAFGREEFAALLKPH
jgi:hypothetical protein